MAFAQIIGALQAHYGEPKLPPARGPFELVLWENACYLLTDERRAEVFEGIRKQAGLTAAAIREAPDEVLLPLAKRGGMRPETRVFRWREIARITLDQFGGDLNQILARPYNEAAKALKLYPNIGEPGAEKILLLCGVARGLPLESNGLRVLTRLGHGRVQKSYGATYKSAQEAIHAELPRDAAALAAAHLLLREHGKTICRDQSPACHSCPVATSCRWAAVQAALYLRG